MIGDDDIPKTEQEWRANPSRKLDILVGVCLHHLAKDNACPLKYDRETQSLMEDRSFKKSPYPSADLRGAPLGPDKIIIYSAFPSNIRFIGEVCTSIHYFLVRLTIEFYASG